MQKLDKFLDLAWYLSPSLPQKRKLWNKKMTVTTYVVGALRVLNDGKCHVNLSDGFENRIFKFLIYTQLAKQINKHAWIEEQDNKSMTCMILVHISFPLRQMADFESRKKKKNHSKIRFLK